MKSIVTSSVFALLLSAPAIVVAQGAPSGPASTPVTLPEEPETGGAAAPATGKDGAAPGPSSDQKAPSSPPAAVAPSPAPFAPPGVILAPPPQMYAPPVGAPAGPPAGDSGPWKRRGPLASRFNVAVNVDTVWYTGPSFDLFSEHNNATAPGLSLGYALWIDEPLSIVPEIGWSTNKVSEDHLFGGAISRTELLSHNAYGALSVRYGIISFLEAHVRVAGGASFLSASVQPGGGTPALEDSGVSPFGSLGAGFNVHSPAGALETRSGRLRSMVAGITVEGGYQLGGAVDLHPTPTADTGRVPTTYMLNGTLERSGPYVRTSLVVRF